jgi:hypothetical protein
VQYVAFNAQPMVVRAIALLVFVEGPSVVLDVETVTWGCVVFARCHGQSVARALAAA